MHIKFRNLNKKAQHLVEYTVTLILVLIAIMIGGRYAIRAWNAQLKTWEDSVTDSFNDPLEQEREGVLVLPASGAQVCDEVVNTCPGGEPACYPDPGGGGYTGEPCSSLLVQVGDPVGNVCTGFVTLPATDDGIVITFACPAIDNICTGNGCSLCMDGVWVDPATCEAPALNLSACCDPFAI